MRRGGEVSSDCLTREDARRLVARCGAIAGGVDAGVVVCGKHSAYIERSDPAFFDQVDRYYARLQMVEDLLDVVDDDDPQDRGVRLRFRRAHPLPALAASPTSTR